MKRPGGWRWVTVKVVVALVVGLTVVAAVAAIAASSRADAASCTGCRTVITLPPRTTTTTTEPPPTTTVPPPTTTTVPRTTTTTTPGTTTTTTLPATTTTLAPRSPSPTSPPMIQPSAQLLTLDRSSAPPGASLTAYGQGCQPMAPVILDISSRPVGTAMANQAGTFSAPVSVPDLAVGQYPVVARCGPTLTTEVGVVLLTRVDPATATFVVLFFFVLIGLVVIRHHLG